MKTRPCARSRDRNLSASALYRRPRKTGVWLAGARKCEFVRPGSAWRWRSPGHPRQCVPAASVNPHRMQRPRRTSARSLHKRFAYRHAIGNFAFPASVRGALHGEARGRKEFASLGGDPERRVPSIGRGSLCCWDRVPELRAAYVAQRGFPRK